MEIQVYSRVELFNKLNELKQEGTKNSAALDYLIDGMLFYIGDSDAQLRDKTIYHAFCYLICESDCLSKGKLLGIRDVICDQQHLFYKIGNKNDDSVLTRSFSILVVALLIHRNQQSSFMNQEQLSHTKECVLSYFEQECDYRGYDQRVGWIHAIAHCADALDEIVLSNGCTHEDCQRILNQGIKIFLNDTIFFMHEEDERFVTVIQSMLNLQLIQRSELEAFQQQLRLEVVDQEYATYLRYLNGKQLDRSIQCRLNNQ